MNSTMSIAHTYFQYSAGADRLLLSDLASPTMIKSIHLLGCMEAHAILKEVACPFTQLSCLMWAVLPCGHSMV